MKNIHHINEISQKDSWEKIIKEQADYYGLTVEEHAKFQSFMADICDDYLIID